jgi:hypothetical protein
LQVSPAWVCHGDVRVEQRLRPFGGLSLRHVRAAYIGRWRASPQNSDATTSTRAPKPNRVVLGNSEHTHTNSEQIKTQQKT